ncbi:pulmonary surfactant-associated protein B-like isoform X2 [Anguilla anguilla]|uniref:pulmonary surfactant-associated protein B-like isoform X2 n=1 Tax=Anguilla anguilla TaxID=7936 RepID=UPI0015AAE04C|nr:pulmonary surfactant-associated protein B-like isoform X2 [Anguilla anguilla]
MKMKSPIILCFLLVYAACIPPGHSHDEGFSETEDGLALQTLVKNRQKIPGVCYICKFIIRQVQAAVPNGTKAVIENELHNVCNQMNFFVRGICKGLVSKYFMQLVDELMAHKGAHLACKIIQLCW